MDAEIGLLIASDVPEALDPLKLSAMNMAVLTPEGLVLAGRLGHHRSPIQTTGFLQSYNC